MVMFFEQSYETVKAVDFTVWVRKIRLKKMTSVASKQKNLESLSVILETQTCCCRPASLHSPGLFM
jgi:hypothetical protein